MSKGQGLLIEGQVGTSRHISSKARCSKPTQSNQVPASLPLQPTKIQHPPNPITSTHQPRAPAPHL
jgi:hypothetical protein